MFFLIGNIEYLKSHPSFYFTKKSPQVVSPDVSNHILWNATLNWLVVEPTHLKNMSQIGSFPQVGWK